MTGPVATWGSLLNQNKLGEFAKQGLTVQAAARANLGASGGFASTIINLMDQLGGSTPTGQDCTAAYAACLALAAANPGSTIVLPAGVVNFASQTVSFSTPSNTTIAGAGMGRTIVTWPDTGTLTCINSAGTSEAPAVNLEFRDFTIQGTFTNSQNGAYPIYISHTNGVRFTNFGVDNSRVFSICAQYCTAVEVRGCRVRWGARDGINISACSQVSIVGNTVLNCGDNGISTGSEPNTGEPWGVRSDILIDSNYVFGCLGILVGTARNLVVSGNILNCNIQNGISIENNLYPGSDDCDATIGALITGNIITNVINRQYLANLSQGAAHISVRSQAATAGNRPAIPGLPNPSGGAIEDPNNYFQSNATSSTVAVGGSRGIIITCNYLARTLPACNGTATNQSTGKTYNSWTDFGMGPIYLPSGAVNPSLATIAYSGDGVEVLGTWTADITISQNHMEGLAAGVTLADTVLLEKVTVVDNKFSNILDYGVILNDTAKNSVDISFNTFDMDPYQLNPNRGPQGTWLTSTGPYAFDAQSGAGVTLRGNKVRNACGLTNASLTSASDGVFADGNILECNPVTTGFSTSNQGVGTVNKDGNTRIIQYGCDPTNATAYGEMLSNPYLSASVMPTSGFWVEGNFVRNTIPVPDAYGNFIVGWLRMTTGSSNVLGTDWTQAVFATKSQNPAAFVSVGTSNGSVGGLSVLSPYGFGLYYSTATFPLVTIAAPPSGGTQATATASVNWQPPLPPVASAGAHNAPGDVLTAVGGTYSAPVALHVDTVDGNGGVLTAHFLNNGTYTAYPPSNPMTFTSSNGSASPPTFDAVTHWGIQAFTVTAAGSNYVGTPTATVTAGDVQNTGQVVVTMNTAALFTKTSTQFGAFTSGAPTANGFITITDATGATRKLLCG